MRNLQGATLGFIAGAVDCWFYISSGLPVTSYDIATALTFWTSVGWIIHITGLRYQTP